MYFIRTASEKDAAAISALLIASFDATYEPLHGKDKVSALNRSWNQPEAVRQCIKDPAGEFLVADNGTEIGGAAYATRAADADKTARLSKLYVRPGRLRQGIGENLLAEVETCFPHAARMVLEVDAANESAIGFYAAHGFHVTGRTENCGSAGSGIPALIMEKTLGATASLKPRAGFARRGRTAW